MIESSYGYAKNLGNIGFDEALTKVANALKTEGFGVLTEIDVKATFKKKLDAEFRKYKILGACNPHFAHGALSKELEIGLLLPCNIIVYEDDNETITASFASPQAMFKIVDNPEMKGFAEEVDAKIRRVVDAV